MLCKIRSLQTRFLMKLVLVFGMGLTVHIAHAEAGQAHFVLDVNTGKVLSSENADVLNHPASLTKIMTLYMTFEALHDGRQTWDTKIVMTRNGAATIPTKLGVPAGKTLTVREAVLGMIIKSANDAAETIGDHLAGSEQKFGQAMTRKAHQLGMTRTTFRNGSGLPDARQVTTARDMATLAIALMRDYPKEYALFAERSFVFRGRKITGHNNLMYRYKGMDGIKTGFTNASGFNLVSAVNDNGRRIIGVVLGGKTARSRDNRMAALLDAAMPKAVSRSEVRIAKMQMVSELELPKVGVPLPIAAERSAEVASISDCVTNAIQATLPTRTGEGLGWEIQIAASNSSEAANKLLEEARRDILTQNKDVSPYTQRIQSGSATLYRARFAGFESRSSALSACKTLRSHSYSCMVLANKS